MSPVLFEENHNKYQRIVIKSDKISWLIGPSHSAVCILVPLHSCCRLGELLGYGNGHCSRNADGPTEVAAFLKACDFQDVSTNAWGLFLRTWKFERLLKQRAVFLTWNPVSFGVLSAIP